MVRRCCAPQCLETDISILAHRFPKDDKIAAAWQKALNLENTPLETLRVNFSVCTKHFSQNSYRNNVSNCLNSTALPNSKENPDNERITTSRSKEKSLSALRCHKRPSTISLVQSIKSEVISSPKPEQVRVISNKRVKLDSYSEQSEAATAAKIIQDFEDESLGCEYLVNEQNDTIPQNEVVITYNNQSTSTTRVTYSDAEVQTDEVVENKVEEESKDERLIKLLYPEFAKFTKIDLIKIIIEKNEAIRNLL